MSELSEQQLLKRLLEDRERFVSGNDLAEMFGVSRVSVWSYFEDLRRAGFEFSAVRNRGYRLEKEPERVHGPLLRAYLELAGCPARIHCFGEVDSTNRVADTLLADGADDPLFALAVRQTAGRGRLGRAWFSEDDGNIFLSMAARSKVAPARLRGYAVWQGLQVCRRLRAVYGVPFQIKWPNDIVCEGKKIAGLLTEMRVDADLAHAVVFGIGFNVNGTFKNAPEAVRNVAGSLRALTGKKHSVNKVAADIIQCLLESHKTFLADDRWHETLAAQWPEADALAGKDICASGLDGTTRQARALTIAPDGGLRVRFKDGTEDVLQAGDVTLSKLAR